MNPSSRMIKVTVHEKRRVNEEQPTPASSPSRNHESAVPRQHPLICTGAEPIHQFHGPPKPRAWSPFSEIGFTFLPFSRRFGCCEHHACAGVHGKHLLCASAYTFAYTLAKGCAYALIYVQIVHLALKNEDWGVHLVYDGTCCSAWGVVFDRRKNRDVVYVFSILNAGGSACGCMCVYTHTHTHTA